MRERPAGRDPYRQKPRSVAREGFLVAESIRFSGHSYERMRRRGATEQEVVETIRQLRGCPLSAAGRNLGRTLFMDRSGTAESMP